MTDPGKGKYAVIGLGSFGSTVALELERLGNEVLGVDQNEEAVNAIADRLAHVVITNVREERNLQELGLVDYDAVVVAIGENLESNILCTIALKQMGVKQVWVKAVTASHHRVLNKLGADRIIHPEHEMGEYVAQALNYPYVLDYIPLGNDYFVVEIEATEAIAGRTVTDLDLESQYDVRFVALKHGRQPMYEEATGVTLAEGMRLVLVGPLSGLRRFGRSL
ncbi:MAG TPA: TrkA family potassium uptake protein [Gammaproteobacteria bacterium]|nr:TrkA family potassium uptake protein [Gammaproteobacteria bacterium]